jgi:hypothetical protein
MQAVSLRRHKPRVCVTKVSKHVFNRGLKIPRSGPGRNAAERQKIKRDWQSITHGFSEGLRGMNQFVRGPV